MTLMSVCKPWLGLMVALSCVSACQSISSLTSYALTDTELESNLQSKLSSLSRQTDIAGIPVNLSIDNVGIQIGPEGREVVKLASIATAGVNVFGFEYPASVRLELEAQPVYDHQQKAIYLRQVTLLDSSVEAGGYKGNLAPVSEQFNQLLNEYLLRNPVYKLDTSNKLINVLSQLPLELVVEPGALRIVPAATQANKP